MITLFIVLANGIVIRCLGAACDTSSTALYTAIAGEGLLELVFVLKGIIKIFKQKDK